MALDQLESFMNALGQLESGNNYGAVGPQTKTYGRARGRFQIMEKIWPAWAREAGIPGASYNDPAAQDRVARHKMTQYYNRYGSWDLVAVAWFAGPARADKAKKSGIASVGKIKDVLGTDVASYVQKVNANMGKAGGATPGSDKAAMPQRGSDKKFIQPPRPTGQGYMEGGGILGGLRKAVTGSTPSENWASIEGTFNSDMPEEMDETQKAQVGQDTFGAILSTISNASRNKGGQILDLKSFLGMPERDTGMPIEQVEAELAAQPIAEGTPPPTDGPLGPEPDHPGFAGLTDESKVWSRQVLGRFPGLRFSSGHRTEEQNRRANGVPNSKHLTGKATDFSGSEKEMQAAAEWAKSQGAKVLIHDAGSGRHLHISWP
jgi:hypothetical protein